MYAYPPTFEFIHEESSVWVPVSFKSSKQAVVPARQIALVQPQQAVNNLVAEVDFIESTAGRKGRPPVSRSPLKAKHLRRLQREFKLDRVLTKAKRRVLALATGRTTQQIYKWFWDQSKKKEV